MNSSNDLLDRKFDVKKLTGLPRNFMDEAMEKLHGTDPLMIFAPFIASFGAMVNNKLCMERGNIIRPCHWMFILAPSGAGKSTAMRCGAQFALSKSSLYMDEINRVMKKLEDLGTNTKKKELKKSLLEEKEQLIALNPIFPDKGSVEGFMQDMSYGQKGLIYAPEASLLFENLYKEYNSGMKPQFIKSHDGGDKLIHITRTNGRLYIKDPFLGICAASTIDGIKKFLTEEDVRSGFLARMLFLNFPSIKNKKALHGVINDSSYKDECSMIVNAIIEKEGCLKMVLSDESEEHFTLACSIIDSCTHKESRIANLLKPFKERWKDYILSLAMPISRMINVTDNVVCCNAIDIALDIIAHAARSTIYLIKNHIGLSDFYRDCLDIHRWLKKQWRNDLVVPHVDLINYGPYLDDNIKTNVRIDKLIAQEKIVPMIDTKGVWLPLESDNDQISRMVIRPNIGYASPRLLVEQQMAAEIESQKPSA